MSFLKAEEAYREYHSRQPFLAPLRSFDKSKEAFLPFWALSGTASIRLHSARIGFRSMPPGINSKKPQNTEVVYQTVFFNLAWEKNFLGSQEEMQVRVSEGACFL